jgi:hypothetical protein
MRSAKFFSEANEKPFGAANVLEPIAVVVLDNVAYQPRAKLAEPFERIVVSSTVNMARR